MRLSKLPGEQVDALEKVYKTAKDPRFKARVHAIWLKARGYSRQEVVQIQGVGLTALGRWIHKYNKYGLTGLLSKPFPGNHRKLTNQQKAQIKDQITNHSPKDFQLEGVFWSVPLLQEFIQQQYQIKYSKPSCRRLFHWCEFSFHKPNKVNKRKNPHLRKQFEEQLKKDWRGIEEKMVWYW